MGLFSKKKRPANGSLIVDTIIGAKAVVEGSLRTQNSICIDGVFKGRITCKGQVILNQSGHLEADIVATYVSIRGRVTGNVIALEQLDIGSTGVVRGDVKTTSVTIDKGGVLDGTCKMLSASEAEACRSSLPSFKELEAPGAKGVAQDKRPRAGGNGPLPKGQPPPKTPSETAAPVADPAPKPRPLERADTVPDRAS